MIGPLLLSRIQFAFTIAGSKVVCSNVPEIQGNKALDPEAKLTDLADVDYGVVRAAFAVAETGSVCLTDGVPGINTPGYLPQHLIVLLDPADIVPNIHHAYRRPEWRRVHYAVLQTGPSATADIEGVLIHGAQGIRSLSVLPLARGNRVSGVAASHTASPS
jgi:L-lactate dehydrogenase complex protein LldG